MDKAILLGQMGEGTSEDTKMMKKKERELSFGRMGESMKETGMKDYNTVKEFLLVGREHFDMLFGLRERGKIG